MNNFVILTKVSFVVKNLFDRKTGEELENIKAHFADAYNDAQLCALVAVGLICRVFGLVPPQQKGARSMWSVVGLFVQFLKTLQDQPEMYSRAVPSPLDIMIEDGLQEMDT